MSDLTVRTFSEGDEPAIVELFNRVYGEYGGFVPRTVEYWHWCCLERPDVKRDGILIAFDGERICGYIVAGSSGNIWEFCVVDDNREIGRALLDEAMIYLEKVGASSVNVNMPRDASIIESLQEIGFSIAPAGGMFVTTLYPARLVQALVTPRKKVLVERFDDEFSFRLRVMPNSVGKTFSVKIHETVVEVIEGFPSEPSIVVELELVHLLSVLFGGSSAARLLFTGKMRVKPFRKFGVVLKLLSTLCLKSPWFFPLSDLI